MEQSKLKTNIYVTFSEGGTWEPFTGDIDWLGEAMAHACPIEGRLDLDPKANFQFRFYPRWNSREIHAVYNVHRSEKIDFDLARKGIYFRIPMAGIHTPFTQDKVFPKERLGEQPTTAFAPMVEFDDGTSSTYSNMVKTLVKKFPRLKIAEFQGPVDLAKDFNSMAEKLEFMHLAIGLATEASEAADVIKAHAIYGKEFDRVAFIKELGDLCFWIQDAQNKFGITEQEILQGNADKLSKRYKDLRYSDTQAITRVDKRFVVCNDAADYKLGLYLAGPFEHLYEAEHAAMSLGMRISQCVYILPEGKEPLHGL